MNISISTLTNLLPFLVLLSQAVDASHISVASGSNTDPMLTSQAIKDPSIEAPITNPMLTPQALKDPSVEAILKPVPVISSTTPPTNHENAFNFYKSFFESKQKTQIESPTANTGLETPTSADITKKASLMSSIKAMLPFGKKENTAHNTIKPEGRIMPPTTPATTAMTGPIALTSLPVYEIKEGEAIASGMGSYYEKFSKLLEIERLINLSLSNSGKKPSDIELSKLPPSVRIFVIANKISHEIFGKVPCPTDDKDPLRKLCLDEKKYTEDLISKVHSNFPFADDAYAAWIHTEPIPTNGFLSGIFGHKKFLVRMKKDQLQRISTIFHERNNALAAWDKTVPEGQMKKSQRIADSIKELTSSITLKLAQLEKEITEVKQTSTWKESTTCLQAGYKAFKIAITEFQEESTKIKELNAYVESTPAASSTEKKE